MSEKIENYTEYLFTVALNKCGDIADAEDLTQEVLLAAYAYVARGYKIDNIKSWLSSTLNHKYYDMLRRKYKMPTVSMDVVTDKPLYKEPSYESLQENTSSPPAFTLLPEKSCRPKKYALSAPMAAAGLPSAIVIRKTLTG